MSQGSSSGVWRSEDSSEGEKGGVDTDLGPVTHITGEGQRQTTYADFGAQTASENVEHTPADTVAEGCRLAEMLPSSGLLSEASSLTVSIVTNSNPSLQTVISFKTHLGNRQKEQSEVLDEPSDNNGLPLLSLLDNNSMSVEDADEKLTEKTPNSLPSVTMNSLPSVTTQNRLPSVTMATDRKWPCEPAGSSSDEYDKQVGEDASFSITANVGRVEEEDAQHLERVRRDHLTPAQTPGGLSAVSQHSSSGSSASPMSSGAINYKVRWCACCSYACANKVLPFYTVK